MKDKISARGKKLDRIIMEISVWAELEGYRDHYRNASRIKADWWI